MMFIVKAIRWGRNPFTQTPGLGTIIFNLKQEEYDENDQ